jgi:predicted SnoaL-like aldol condensation-catalyzing enzyme
MAGSGDVKAAFDQFVAPDFVHHNPYFKGDRQSLMEAMEASHKMSPNKSIDVKQIFEDRNTVITHSLVTREDPSAPPIAVVHIFRFANNRIAELWDVGQEITRDSPNQNGPF